MRRLVLVLACAASVKATPYTWTVAGSAICTTGSGTTVVGGIDGCNLGSGQDHAAVWTQILRSVEQNDEALSVSAFAGTNMTVITTDSATAEGFLHIHMTVNMTTPGPERDGKITVRVDGDGEAGRVSLKLGDLIDYTNGPGSGSTEFYRLPFTVGKPFQIEMDSFVYGDAGYSRGRSVSFVANAWEKRIYYEDGNPYADWYAVPVTLYDGEMMAASPEPSSILLIGSGLLACAYRLRNHKIKRG